MPSLHNCDHAKPYPTLHALERIAQKRKHEGLDSSAQVIQLCTYRFELPYLSEKWGKSITGSQCHASMGLQGKEQELLKKLLLVLLKM